MYVCHLNVKSELFFTMQIPEIRSRLSLSKVLAHYNWKPDARGRMRCPFHDDKSPSLQTYPETGTVYCFAGSCPTHGRSLDVIDIIKEKENCTKHEAILKAKQLAGSEPKPLSKSTNTNRSLADEAARAAVLAKVWTTMKSGLALSTVAKGYLEKRGLDYKLVHKAGAGVGYNSGQLHYRTKSDPATGGMGKSARAALIESCLKYGLLSDSGKKSRTGEPAYTTFAKGAVVFALKTQGGKIGGLYFRSVNDKGGRHFYLRDRKGLWPRWPELKTKRLLVCESIIDAASVLQDERIQKAWSVLALYGTNGWTAEHTEALDRLDELEEICLLLDGDAAGKRATDTYAKKVRALWPSVQVTSVELPGDEDANGVLVKSGAEVLAQAIIDRCEVVFSSTDPSTPTSFRMTGQLKSDATNPSGMNTITLKVDLYEYREVEKACRLAAEKLGLDERAVAADLERLARELEGYAHRKRKGGASEQRKVEIPADVKEKCLSFLRQPNLIKVIGERIGRAGIVGEEANRVLLFVVASSYKMPDTLHALIQGSSGSGKTRLLDVVARCMPPEDLRISWCVLKTWTDCEKRHN